jgi:hypothetical protein
VCAAHGQLSVILEENARERRRKEIMIGWLNERGMKNNDFIHNVNAAAIAVTARFISFFLGDLCVVYYFLRVICKRESNFLILSWGACDF